MSTKIDLHTLVVVKGEGKMETLGLADANIYRMDKQQDPTI